MSHSLTRREVLAAGVGLAFASAAVARIKPEILDAHIHLYDPTRPGGVPFDAQTAVLGDNPRAAYRLDKR